MSSQNMSAVYKARSSKDIPADAILLTEEEARKHQWNVIHSWKPRTDVWPFTFGVGILGGAAAMTGFYFNNFYRRKLKLRNFGLLSSYLPIAVFPTVIALILHQEMVANNIIIEKIPCASCVEIRAATIQALTGSLYPLLLAPIANFLLANRYMTYSLHPITEPKQLFQQFREISGPLLRNFRWIFILQAAIGAGITHLEFKAFINLNKKLIQDDEILFDT